MALKVNYGALDAASSDLDTGAKNIQNALDQMDTELQQLMTNWEGEAQLAYQHAKKEWTEGMTGMRDVLGRIGMLVAAANQDYGHTDRFNASKFMH